jgi:acyl-homoserine-lactone acylase
VVDAYGVALTGAPLVNIGFNAHVAWTHTVTTANHFTIYRLDLAAGAPTTYLYDGAERPMTSQEYSIQVKRDDGGFETATRTLYRSHYGPMITIPGLDWTETNAYTFRDANHRNVDLARTWREMARAESLADLEAVQAEAHGIPWVNTMATSAEGVALFFDASRTPQLSAAAEAAYRRALERQQLDVRMAGRRPARSGYRLVCRFPAPRTDGLRRERQRLTLAHQPCGAAHRIFEALRRRRHAPQSAHAHQPSHADGDRRR